MKKINLIEKEIDFYLDLYLGECELDASDSNVVKTGKDPDIVPKTLEDIEDDLGGEIYDAGDVEDDKGLIKEEFNLQAILTKYPKVGPEAREMMRNFPQLSFKEAVIRAVRKYIGAII
jgi:hypothetical protein